MTTKKQIERQHLEIVRRGVDDFPNGTIEDTERPDFLVQSGESVLGIEVTRIFSHGNPGSRPPKSQESERDLVVERAQAIAQDRGICRLWVRIEFNSRQPIGKHDRNAIAERLVDLVCAHLPAADERRTLENRHPVTGEFPPQVQGVLMWRPTFPTSHLWHSGVAGFVNEDFAPQLQHSIAEKDAHVPVYRTGCDQCWLVVVADWRGPSGFFEMSDEMSGRCYQTAFDRVYFVDGFSGCVVRLRTGTTVP